MFWYKAQPHDDFKLCKKEVWDWHYKHVNKKKQARIQPKPRLEDVTQTNHKISVDVEKIWDQSICGPPR